MDPLEHEDNIAWEAEVNRVNNKFLLNSFYILPITYSGGISFGVYLAMPDRFWEFVPIYFFPIIPITLLFFLRKNKISEHAFLRFLPELTLFICTALATAKADNRFMFFAGLVNIPLFIATSMGSLRKKAETLFIITFGVLANVLIYSFRHNFSNYNIIIAAWCMAAPIAFMAYFLSNSRYSSQKNNFFITRALNRSNHFLAIKNKEIIDSITYAKHLQEAILPPENYWLKNLPDSFILYKPKDIVAGDFYWMETISQQQAEARGEPVAGSSQSSRTSISGLPTEELILIAAADCTGHGVPGAMVSVVCSTALNRSVLEFKQTEPGKILDKTRLLVLETFSRSNKEVSDGMDISLASINKVTGEVKWSGANNPLWYTQNGSMNEIAATKKPIGKTENSEEFKTHILKLSKGDTLYFITDGYADQFGGPKGKKFKNKTLKELLNSNSRLSMPEQKQLLSNSLQKWKADLEQVDDICIIGVRI